MSLDKDDPYFEETIKDKPTVNDSGFVNYSNTITFASKWFKNSDYIITECQTLVIKQAITWFKKLERTRKLIKVGKVVKI